jgi:LPXTG-motif cell wall-anchored protein
MLYASGTRTIYDTSGNIVSQKTSIFPYDAIALNDANNWTYTWNNMPMNTKIGTVLYEYTNYFIRESTTGDWDVYYEDSNGVTLTHEEIAADYTDYGIGYDYVEAVQTTGGTVVIINSAPYALPHTGGRGTSLYTMSGLALMALTGSMYILYCYKRKRACKGGEKTH